MYSTKQCDRDFSFTAQGPMTDETRRVPLVQQEIARLQCAVEILEKSVEHLIDRLHSVSSPQEDRKPEVGVPAAPVPVASQIGSVTGQLEHLHDTVTRATQALEI